jgi:hypothetical protein
MKKSGINNIRTIVVLDSVNLDDQRIINQHNPKVRRSPLSIIKSGGYACVPAMENFGNFYRPYAIFNMSVDNAKKNCCRCQKTSFVFSVLNEDGMVHSEYYTKQDPILPYNKQANDYIKNDECDTWEDESIADGNFMVTGKGFKYGIPYKTLYAVNEVIYENLKRMVSAEKQRGNHSITEERALEYTINGVGLSPYLWRKEAAKGLL